MVGAVIAMVYSASVDFHVSFGILHWLAQAMLQTLLYAKCVSAATICAHMFNVFVPHSRQYAYVQHIQNGNRNNVCAFE